MKLPKALGSLVVLMLIVGGAGIPVAAQDSPVALAFWKMPGLSPEAETAFYAEVGQRFQAEHPNLTMEHLIIPWDSGLEKYTATFSGNDVPDVSYQIVPWLNSFRGQGALAPLEDIGDVSDALEGVNESVVNGAVGPDGKHYGIPYSQSMFVLAVNEDVWERAGSPAPPTTYEEMVPFAQQLTFDRNGKRPGEEGFDANSIETYGWSQPGLWTIQTNYIWNYFWSYGAEIVSEDGKDIGFNNEQGRAALEAMKAMAESAAATPINLYPDGSGWAEAFVQGRIGMAWFERLSPDLVEAYPDVRIKVLESPAGPAGKFLVGGVGYLTIPTKSEHKADALELARFLANDENMGSYIRQAQFYPVKPLGENLYAGIGGPQEAFMNQAVSQIAYVRLTPAGLPYNPEEIIVAEINNYLTGQKELDPMLEDLSRQVGIMARNAGM